MMAVIGPFIVYVGSYFFVMGRKVVVIPTSSGFEIEYHPAALYGGRMAEGFYAPLVQVDRLIRPRRWTPP